MFLLYKLISRPLCSEKMGRHQLTMFGWRVLGTLVFDAYFAFWTCSCPMHFTVTVGSCWPSPPSRHCGWENLLCDYHSGCLPTCFMILITCPIFPRLTNTLDFLFPRALVQNHAMWTLGLPITITDSILSHHRGHKGRVACIAALMYYSGLYYCPGLLIGFFSHFSGDCVP